MADILHTSRLTLRRMELDDAEALHAFFSDPVAMEFWSEPHTTLAETRDWVHNTVTSPEAVTCEFVLQLDDEVIGKAGIWKKPELGYFLRRSHWGKGLMTEALTTLVPYLHERMNAPTLTAEITPGNVASEAILKRLGFREVRRAEKDHWDGEKWCDTGYWEREAKPSG